MDFNKLTQKSQQALQDAQSIAVDHGHQEVDGEHLLLALCRQEDGLIDFALSVDYLPGVSSGNAAGNTEVTSEATTEQGAEDGGSAEEVPTASGRAG